MTSPTKSFSRRDLLRGGAVAAVALTGVPWINRGRFTLFAGTVHAEEFLKSVRRTGRSNESRTVARLFARTNRLKLLKNLPLGLRLMKRGRFSFKAERMHGDLDQLARLLGRGS